MTRTRAVSGTPATRRPGGCDGLDVCRICAGSGSSAGSHEDRQHLAQAALRLRAAFDRASEDSDLTEVWGQLAVTFKGGRLALLAWFDFIEETVQLAERRYGTESGRGSFKAEQIKASIRRMIAQSTSPSKAILYNMGPHGVDLYLDVMLAFIVGLLNRRKLWAVDGTTPVLPRTPLRLRIIQFLGRRVLVLYTLLSVRGQLDPELNDEMARIVVAGGDPLTLLEQLVGAGVWINDNRTTVEALMEMVAIGCDEAEHLSGMTGPEKQAYVRDLLLVTLDQEFGIVLRGLSLLVVEAVIDLLIDLVVSVNNKHGVFPGHTR